MGTGFRWMGLSCPSCGCNGDAKECDIQEVACASMSGCGIDRTSITVTSVNGVTQDGDFYWKSSLGPQVYAVCATGAGDEIQVQFAMQYAVGTGLSNQHLKEKHVLRYWDSNANSFVVYATPSLVEANYSCSGSDTLYIDGDASKDSCTLTWTGTLYDPCCGCNVSGLAGDWIAGEPNWNNVTGEVRNYLDAPFGTLDNTSAEAMVCGWKWDYLYGDMTVESTKGFGQTDVPSVVWSTFPDFDGHTDCYEYSEVSFQNPFGRKWYVCFNGENTGPADCPCKGELILSASCFNYSERIDVCEINCRSEDGMFVVSEFIYDEGLPTEETVDGTISELDSSGYNSVDKLYGFATSSSGGVGYRYLWFGSRGAVFNYRWGWHTTETLVDIGDPINCEFIGYPDTQTCSETINENGDTHFVVSGHICGDKT